MAIVRDLTFGAQACNNEGYRQIENTIKKIDVDEVKEQLCLALLPPEKQDIEHTASQSSPTHVCHYKDMIEYAQSQDWDTCEIDDEPYLECITCVVLITLLKHTGLLSTCISNYE